MRKSKFSEHQIIAILKAVEAGRTVKDVCRCMRSASLLTISGSRSSAAWRRRTFAGCGSEEEIMNRVWSASTAAIKDVAHLVYSVDLRWEHKGDPAVSPFVILIF